VLSGVRTVPEDSAGECVAASSSDDEFWGCVGCGCLFFVILPICLALMVVVAKVLWLFATWVWNLM
jgi:hypothetical protein